MADRFVFDLDADYPDVIIDTMRRAVVAAIADLRVHSEQLDASLLLVQTTFDVAQTFLTTVLGIQAGGATLQQTVIAMRQELNALTDRVTALDTPPAPPPVPTTGGAT